MPTAVALPLSAVTAPPNAIAPPTVVASAPKVAASKVIVPAPLNASAPLTSVLPLSVMSNAPVLPLIPAVTTLFCELAIVKSLSSIVTAPVKVTAPVPAVMVRSSAPPLVKVSVFPKVTPPAPAPVPTAVALPLFTVTGPVKLISAASVVKSLFKLIAVPSTARVLPDAPEVSIAEVIVVVAATPRRLRFADEKFKVPSPALIVIVPDWSV